jgi:hypothetical protein
MHIRLSTTLKWPISRQIPTSIHASGIRFSINEPIEKCDAWIIYQGLRRPEQCVVPEGKVFFFCYEPPGLHNYHPRFLRQFDRIISSHVNLNHPDVQIRQQAQPWLAGINFDERTSSYVPRLSYSDFQKFDSTAKKDIELGVICSGKDLVPGHATRRRFVEVLESTFGDRVAIHGNWKDVGNNTYSGWKDKWEFISRVKRLIVLENSRVPHYWSEKLADAFLANCLPIYHGCPNVNDYFPADAFIPIHCGELEDSIATITKCLQSDLCPTQQAAIQAAKSMVLDKYNLFAEIVNLVTATKSSTMRTYRINDESLFLPGSILRRIVRMIR